MQNFKSVISKNVTKNFSKPDIDINPPHHLCLWFTCWRILSSPVNAPKRNNLSRWLKAVWWPNKNYKHQVPFYRHERHEVSRPSPTMTEEQHEQDSHRSTIHNLMSSWLQYANPLASTIFCNVQFKVKIITDCILISWQFFSYKHTGTPIFMFLDWKLFQDKEWISLTTISNISTKFPPCKISLSSVFKSNASQRNLKVAVPSNFLDCPMS